MPPRVKSGFDTELNHKTVRFRGRTYEMQELPIGDYDEITKKATTTKQNIDGTEDEILDSNLQSRLLLAECLLSADPPLPPRGIPGLGTRVVIHLNRVVNELHYGSEPDELVVVEPEAEPGTEGDEETPKGND